MGHVRAAFPGDRARQDLVFPAPDEDSVAASPEHDAEPEPPAGAGEPTGA